MSENNIQIFNFEDFDVRIVDKDGNPWFVANDVGNVLGLSRSAVRDFVSKLKDEYKSVVSIDTNRGPRNYSIISEQGLYKMLMQSRKPNAEKFQDWIAEDVVPKIRKTGSYSTVESPSSHLEVLRSVVDQLIAQEKKLEKVENDVAAIVEDKRQIEEQLYLLPESEVEVQSKSTRAILNQRVRTYAKKSGIPYPEIWNKLYTEFYYTYHINLKIRANRRDMTVLDYVESIGMMDELYSIACKYFA